jgi:hypothetical protein
VAGANVSITGNTISATTTGSSTAMVIQLDGTTQPVTTLNFLQHQSSLVGGILNVSRLQFYDKIPLIYSGFASVKDLAQNVNGDLVFGTDIMVNNTQLTTALSAYMSTAVLTPLLAAKAMSVDVTSAFTTQSALIATKQDVISTVLPLTKEGSIISSLWKPSSCSVGAGLVQLSSDTLGTLNLGLDGTESRVSLKLADTNSVVRDLDTTTDGVLTWDGDPLTTLSQLSTKQNLLSTYSENAAPNTYYIDTNEPSGVFLNGWTSSTDNTGYQTVPSQAHISFSNLPASGSLVFSFQLRGVGGKTDTIFAVNNGLTWSGSQEIKFTGLTADFQTYTWAVSAYTTGRFNLHTYQNPVTNALTQTTGSVDMRFVQLFVEGAPSVIIAAPISCDSLTVLSTVTCVSVIQTSDESIKTNVVDCDLDVIQAVFDAVEVRQYERTDVEGKRIGFIAQDLVKALPVEFDNITQMNYITGNPLLGLDYARLNTILWGVCKNLQSRVAALEDAAAK